jgi:molecular chaperone GrpE
MENNDQKEELKTNEQVGSENSDVATENMSEKQGSGQAEQLLKLQNELAEQKDKFLRLYSEFENFRRRTSKEKLDLITSANEDLIKAFLPVADDFERAEKSFRDKNDKELEGFFLIHNKFRKTLDQYGVKPMVIEPGTAFNADVHEAITQIPAPNENLKGKIVDVVEKGYTLKDKVIRFAKVVVGS